jgi:predicted Rossmann fold flavoprotein
MGKGIIGVLSEERATLAIVGGGAAGLLAAIRAGERLRGNARVIVLEAAKETGRKILVSGGGRCNVLPMVEGNERFVSTSPPRLVKRFLDRYPLAEQRAFFEELLGGALREEGETRKLFPPTNRARDVRDALRGRAESLGVEIRNAAPVRGLETREGGFELRLDGEVLPARAVVLATGGKSVLGGGADARGLDFAAALGHTVRPTYAALAPIVAEGTPHAALTGISLPAAVRARGSDGTAESRGGFLFTHRGYSGPSVLDVSHVVERAALVGAKAEVRVAFLSEGAPALDEELRVASGNLAPFLSRRFPDRLVALLLATAGVPDGPLHRLSRENRRRVVDAVTSFPLPADGTEGYRTAEVMGGGVALEEVDAGSGASKIVPGLYLAGEMLDAFGPIGGFNFQWAFATGKSAGEGAGAFLERG